MSKRTSDDKYRDLDRPLPFKDIDKYKYEDNYQNTHKDNKNMLTNMQCPKMSKRTSDAKCRDLTHPETFEVQFTDQKSNAKTNTRIGWSDLVLP